MLVPFLIMLREGLEAALVVGIIAGYLKQTGRGDWLPAAWTGVAAAVLLSFGLAVALELLSAEFPQREQELFEAIVGLVAVGLLTSMVFWMRGAARSIGSTLRRSVDGALSGGHGAAALVAMVLLAVAREGLESVFFLLAVFRQSSGPEAPVGAVLGVVLAIAVGAAIYGGTVRLPLRAFFRWTGLLILFVAAGILAGAVRSLHEAGLWNHLQETAFDLSHVLPADGPLGTVLAGLFGYQDAPAVGELAAYLLYLAVTLALFFPRPRADAVLRASA